jgi:hypothetical protein
MTRQWDRISSDQLGRPRWILIGIIGFVGFFLRLWVGTAGHNFDFNSFMNTLDTLDISGNVYAENVRYNYGPVWFYILQLLQLLTGLFPHPTMGMEYLMSGFLAFVDIGIYIILLRSFGLLAGILFILNPVSIIITGYHRQFDNLAIFLGMIAVLTYKDSFKQPIDRRKFLGLVVLGLSLMTKHVLFAFPLWLAVKQRGWKEKLVVLLVPVGIFLIGFLPYWFGAADGIIDKVFLYEPYPEFLNAPFWHWFVPNIIRYFTTPTLIFIFALIIGAFIFRKKPGLEALLFYTVILVVTSPTIANQYLAIVIPFISVYFNFFFLLYTIMATWHLLVDKNGLYLKLPLVERMEDIVTFSTIIAVLTIGLIWKPTWKTIKNLVVREVTVQKKELGLPQTNEDKP